MERDGGRLAGFAACGTQLSRRGTQPEGLVSARSLRRTQCLGRGRASVRRVAREGAGVDESAEDEEYTDADEQPCPVDCVIEIETEEAFHAWRAKTVDQPVCRSNTRWSVLEIFSNSCRACIGMKRGVVKACFGHDDIQFLTLNADVLPEIAKGLGVRGFPTFLVYRDGKRVDHFNASSRKTLEEYLDTYVH